MAAMQAIEQKTLDASHRTGIRIADRIRRASPGNRSTVLVPPAPSPAESESADTKPPVRAPGALRTASSAGCHGQLVCPCEFYKCTSTARRRCWIPSIILLAVLFAPHLQSSIVIAATTESISPKARQSVDKALVWLKDHQNPDGTFPQGDTAGTTAVPSLVVMAFLARGHVPGRGPYGQMLYRSIDYVLDSQQPEGLISRSQGGNHVMYEHGIATVMLTEVYGMVDDARRVKIARALAKSVRLILDAQKVPKSGPQYVGGWRYQINSPDADISVTGWQLMALRGAANCGAAVPKSALDAGREYIRRSAVPDGGFGYQPGGGPNQARTGTGTLSLELLGEHNSREAIGGGNYLLKNPPDNPGMEFYYYAVYYCSQALNQLGGKYWDTLYPRLCDALITQQQPDGSFGGGSGQEQEAGPSYRSAMACLALCVPFRYLPLYQK